MFCESEFFILAFLTKLTHSKYDHYCPWLLVPIGERTHRFFLMFLLSNIIASSCLAYNSLSQMCWRISVLSPRIRWTDSKLKNALIITFILSRTDIWVFGLFFVLTVIALTLSIFLIQQIYYVSKNITQIELDKYEDLQEELSKESPSKEVVNMYTKGFWGNWKAFLFPPKVEKRTPLQYYMNGKNIKSCPKGSAPKPQPDTKKEN